MLDKIIVSALPLTPEEDRIYVIAQNNPNSLTHNYFKYPCKFIPEIPRWAINSYLNTNGNNVVLDPFSGSGTTLLEAAIKGFTAYGGEIDEVAKLITKVKTTQLTPDEMQYVAMWVKPVLQCITEGSYDRSKSILPEIKNLTHWFEEYVLYDLGYLYAEIENINNENVQDFLLLCMASIVKRVSNCDDISPKPYVSNKVKKAIPSLAKLFEDTVTKNLAAMRELADYQLGSVDVIGTATELALPDNSVDIAVTSPPYINAFDYVRTMRLENLWLNMETEESLLENKKKYLGTESIKCKTELQKLQILEQSTMLRKCYDLIFSVDEKRALIVKKFFEDMEKNLLEVKRVLKPGSVYAIVIGNSVIREVEIESWRILKDLAVAMGYKYVTHFGYEIKNPYIRIPRGNKGGKIAVDHILVIRK